MADVLSVIADIIKQDKQQKKEHNKVMREVQKKMKEKEVSEEDGPGDGDEYQKFVKTMLKKFGVKISIVPCRVYFLLQTFFKNISWADETDTF